jgi:hypothetical protein
VPSIEKWLSSAKAPGHTVAEGRSTYVGMDMMPQRESVG